MQREKLGCGSVPRKASADAMGDWEGWDGSSELEGGDCVFIVSP